MFESMREMIVYGDREKSSWKQLKELKNCVYPVLEVGTSTARARYMEILIMLRA